MRILSRADIERALSMREAIQVIKDAFAQLSRNEATVPLRLPLPVPAQEGVVLFMPAHLHRSNALAVKVVSVYNKNPARGLPLIHAAVLVLDAETGRTLALLEGSYLTALRTGAASGAATDVLARADARVGLVIGAGAQAHTQLRAICAVRPLERVGVYDALPDRADALISNLRGVEGIPADLHRVTDLPTAVRQADIICTATTSPTPVFDGTDVRAGTHVNSVGSFTPEAREVDSTFIRRVDKIVVDAYSAALAEAGDLLIPMNEGIISESSIYAELGEITGGMKPGRERAAEITFFKTVGVAVQDASVARAVLERAEKLNLGTTVEL